MAVSPQPVQFRVDGYDGRLVPDATDALLDNRGRQVASGVARSRRTDAMEAP